MKKINALRFPSLLTFLLILLLSSNSCVKEEDEDNNTNEKVIKYFNKEWKSAPKSEAFYIREITKIRDSLFIIEDYDTNNRLLMSGDYLSIEPLVENGKFIFYNSTTLNKDAEGYYSKGLMIGKWYFYQNGVHIKTIDYNFQVLIDETNNLYTSTYDLVIMPKFDGSGVDQRYESFTSYISQNITYPPMALKYNIYGKSSIKFRINEYGFVCDIKVINEFNKDLDREAIRVLAHCPAWTPGYVNQKPADFIFIVPINFSIN